MSAIKQLLTYEEARSILGVCRNTLVSLVKRGRLKTVPVGSRNVRFRRRDIDKLAEKGWK
jgi:excisionase family DNA binding protein